MLYRVSIFEFEAKYGKRADFTKEFNTIEEALLYKSQYNKSNKKSNTTGHYMYCDEPELIEDFDEPPLILCYDKFSKDFMGVSDFSPPAS